MHKIVKHIPNAITSLNLLCGALGVVCVAVFRRPDLAFCLMLAGACFDFCDGLSARALGAYSPMGKELDSIADMVSFGLLPSLMLLMEMFRIMAVGVEAQNPDPSTLLGAMWEAHGAGMLLMAVPLVIAVFSGLRLAKFNIDERQSSSFIGLATPANAMICGSLSYMMVASPDCALAQFCRLPWVIPAISLVLSLLLVSEIPMFAMKFHKGEGMSRDMVLRIIFGVVALTWLVLTVIFGWAWPVVLLGTFTSYIIINLINACLLKLAA